MIIQNSQIISDDKELRIRENLSPVGSGLVMMN